MYYLNENLREMKAKSLSIEDIQLALEKCKKKHTEENDVFEAMKEELNVDKFDEAIEQYIKNELSTCAAADPVATPKAFKKKSKKDDTYKEPGMYEEYLNKIDELEIVNENFSELAKHLFVERTYRDYRSTSAKGKVRSSMNEINRKLKEIERILKHTSRFKEEANLGSDNFNVETVRSIRRIRERMMNIVKGLKHLER